MSLKNRVFVRFFCQILITLLTNQLMGQQSYFNVPSSDRTTQKTWFFQQQTNYSAGEFTSNYTFDYGLSKNWEAGINVLQLNVIPKNGLRVVANNDGKNQAFFPLITSNVQRFKKISKHEQLSLGAVGGFDPFSVNFFKSGSVIVFTNYQFHNKFIKFTGGFWGGNNHFVGVGDRIYTNKLTSSLGLQFGGEFHIGHRQTLVFDHISGKTPMSMSTLGFTKYFHKYWIFSLGAQIPNHQHFRPNGIVLEFTRVM